MKTRSNPIFFNFIDACELMYSMFDEKNKEYLSKMTKYNTGTCNCKKIKCWNCVLWCLFLFGQTIAMKWATYCISGEPPTPRYNILSNVMIWAYNKNYPVENFIFCLGLNNFDHNFLQTSLKTLTFNCKSTGGKCLHWNHFMGFPERVTNYREEEDGKVEEEKTDYKTLCNRSATC